MNNYPQTRLGDIATLHSGGTPSTENTDFYSGDTPWISSADIGTGGSVLIRRHISKESLLASSARIAPPGSLLLVTRVGVGKTCISPCAVSYSQDIVWVNVDDDVVDRRYLRHFLSTFGSKRLKQLSRGATIRGVSLKDVRELHIPLPSLQEQLRIAQVLESAELMAKSTLPSRSDLVSTLVTTQFERLFLQPGRDWTTIGEYLESTQYGTSSKASETGRTPILRMGNITYDGKINFGDLKFIDLPPEEEKKYDLRGGDLLFNRTNSKELVGKTAIYRNTGSSKMTFAGYLIRARTIAGATPEYISAYLNSRHGKAALELRAKAIVGMANINATELKNLPVPAASLDEQSTFASFHQAAEEAIKLASFSIRLGDELYKSLSTRAFAGEL